LGKKSKNLPKSGVAVLFMRDYFNLYTKKVWSCMELFFVFETIEHLPFMIKNQNPFCLSFGVSTITLLLIFLLIKVAYFWNRLFNAYQTVPSRVLDFFFSIRFFVAQKGVFNFRKKRLTRYNHLSALYCWLTCIYVLCIN